MTQAIMTALTSILEGVFKWYNTAIKEPQPHILATKRFIHGFWIELGSHIKLLQSDNVELGLTYQCPMSTSSLDMRSRLGALALHSILFW